MNDGKGVLSLGPKGGGNSGTVGSSNEKLGEALTLGGNEVYFLTAVKAILSGEKDTDEQKKEKVKRFLEEFDDNPRGMLLHIRLNDAVAIFLIEKGFVKEVCENVCRRSSFSGLSVEVFGKILAYISENQNEYGSVDMKSFDVSIAFIKKVLKNKEILKLENDDRLFEVFGQMGVESLLYVMSNQDSFVFSDDVVKYSIFQESISILNKRDDVPEEFRKWLWSEFFEGFFYEDKNVDGKMFSRAFGIFLDNYALFQDIVDRDRLFCCLLRNPSGKKFTYPLARRLPKQLIFRDLSSVITNTSNGNIGSEYRFILNFIVNIGCNQINDEVRQICKANEVVILRENEDRNSLMKLAEDNGMDGYLGDLDLDVKFHMLKMFSEMKHMFYSSDGGTYDMDAYIGSLYENKSLGGNGECCGKEIVLLMCMGVDISSVDVYYCETLFAVSKYKPHFLGEDYLQDDRFNQLLKSIDFSIYSISECLKELLKLFGESLKNLVFAKLLIHLDDEKNRVGKQKFEWHMKEFIDLRINEGIIDMRDEEVVAAMLSVMSIESFSETVKRISSY